MFEKLVEESVGLPLDRLWLDMLVLVVYLAAMTVITGVLLKRQD